VVSACEFFGWQENLCRDPELEKDGWFCFKVVGGMENPPIGSIYHLYTIYIIYIYTVYTTYYILPSFGGYILYATYHCLREPETTIEDWPRHPVGVIPSLKLT